jgi:outer membrane receptor protein involved in Fe transport
MSADGPMFSVSLMRPIGAHLHMTAFAFFDHESLGVGVDRRPLDILFANPPLSLPADAEFTGLDGSETDAGLGIAFGGPAHWRFLPSFEWSAGLMYQRIQIQDFRFDYRILGGPDAGVTGSVDYSATYTHLSPFLGAAWPRTSGRWIFTPHLQIAMPLPKRGFAGRITGPGFDLAGDQAANGYGKHFGDPSITAGFNLTYQPWDLTVDLGSAVWQAVIEPRFHEGLEHDLMLSAYRTF